MTIGFERPPRSFEQKTPDRDENPDSDTATGVVSEDHLLLRLTLFLRKESNPDQIAVLEEEIATIRANRASMQVPIGAPLTGNTYPYGFNSANDRVYPKLSNSLAIERPTPVASLYAIAGSAPDHAATEAQPLRIGA